MAVALFIVLILHNGLSCASILWRQQFHGSRRPRKGGEIASTASGAQASAYHTVVCAGLFPFSKHKNMEGLVEKRKRFIKKCLTINLVHTVCSIKITV